MTAADAFSILVVDDEPELRKAIAFDLRRKGFNVFEADNGNDAFEIAKSNDIRLILSDMKMPNGDGGALLDRIKRHNPDIFFLLITGFADISVEEAYDRGANAVFSKPFDRKALMNVVQKVVERSRSEPESLRKFDREEANFAVELRVPASGSVIFGQVSNLSQGGFFLKSDATLAVGAEVSFQIRIDEGSLGTIDATGIVKWVREAVSGGLPQGCGIVFTSLSEESRRKIIQVVNRLKTKSNIPRGLA